ncbi:MAG: hypothetical protein AB1689_15785 [Thermodesulfobacteriota bacterium]
MRKFFTGGLVALALCAASDASAIIVKQDAGAKQTAPRGTLNTLGQVAKLPPPEFSEQVMDPAQCNYEYVDVEARMIVRSQLKMTCAIRQ